MYFFVYSGVEDFGIAPVEAMAAGAPVIGLGKGGLLDTVRCIHKGASSPTGLLFSNQTVSSLVQAVAWFEEAKLWRRFSAEEIRLWANNFHPDLFTSRFEAVLRKAWQEHSRECANASIDPVELFSLGR